MQQTSTGSEAREYAGGKMLARQQDGIGIVTFNQPAKRNAISVEMWRGLGEILDEFAENPEVRVVVLTGAGTQAFVSGADISQFEQHRNNAEAQRAYDEQTSRPPQAAALREADDVHDPSASIRSRAPYALASAPTGVAVPSARRQSECLDYGVVFVSVG